MRYHRQIRVVPYKSIVLIKHDLRTKDPREDCNKWEEYMLSQLIPKI